MYDTIIDLKTELEGSCNIKIDLNKHMENVEKELKNKGYKTSKSQFDSIRKAIKKKEKKHSKHANYLACTAHIDGYEFNEVDEELMFPEFKSSHGKDKNKDKEDDKEEIYVPAQLVFGVTLTLCGLFLMVIPFPACKPRGERMIASGFVICGNCISGKVDADNKNNKK